MSLVYRGLYGSPVGYIDVDDDCEFIVAIRSMLIKQNQTTLFAGCGIVKDSNAESEVEGNVGEIFTNDECFRE